MRSRAEGPRDPRARPSYQRCPRRTWLHRAPCASHRTLWKERLRPALLAQGRSRHLQWLLSIHLLRYFGFAALLPGVFDLGRAGFTHDYLAQVAWGDYVACLLALAAVSALRWQSSAAVPLVWVFNVVGTLDYLNAGGSITPKIHDPNLIGPFGWYIFTVFLPAWLVSHVAIFYVLLRVRDAGPVHAQPA